MKELTSIIEYIKSNNIHFVDFRFTDSSGTWRHITLHADQICESVLTKGIAFDASSIEGWKAINKSDALLYPDISSIFKDPFTVQDTIVIICNVIDPETQKFYNRDPRSVCTNSLKYLKSEGIADDMLVGNELEYFVFDDVKWNVDYFGSSYKVDSASLPHNSNKDYSYGNNSYRPGAKGAYFVNSPIDHFQDLRSEILSTIKSVNIEPILHHAEVAPSQCEIGFKHSGMVLSADNVMKCKYVVHNVVNSYGKTATFMPKILNADNGSGMHCHISLIKDGANIFASDDISRFCGLSDIGLWFVGGILKHIRSLNLFTNSTTNSYKRLVKGFEAPVTAAFSANNRSAAIRIPYDSSTSRSHRRVELRFPDAVSNPYYASAAILMAGIDGIKNKIDPSDLYVEKDLFTANQKELKKYSSVCSSLSEAIEAIQEDHEYLLQDNVFNKDQIDAYIQLKNEESKAIIESVHPVELMKYYHL